jgi:hypothetical protein
MDTGVLCTSPRVLHLVSIGSMLLGSPCREAADMPAASWVHLRRTSLVCVDSAVSNGRDGMSSWGDQGAGTVTISRRFAFGANSPPVEVAADLWPSRAGGMAGEGRRRGCDLGRRSKTADW